jgi:hypothetical protein
MATDHIRINKFEVCKKFNLSKYVCELPPERRQCDGVCIKASEKVLSPGLEEVVGESVDS